MRPWLKNVARLSSSRDPAPATKRAPSRLNAACHSRPARPGAAGCRRNSVPPTGSPANAAASAATPAVLAWRRPSTSLPKAANTLGSVPLPTPSSSRPPLSVSSTAASSATRSGSSSGRVTTAVPSRIRRVRSATAARNGNGEGSRPAVASKWCWATQPESNPSSSAATNSST